MRKRKSPIVLVTVLAVVVASVVGFQFVSSRNPDAAMQPPTPEVQDTKPVGDARPGQSAQQTANSVQQAMNSKSKTAMDPESMGGPAGPGGAGPLILGPSHNAKAEKPKPNTSATSAQWYNDESALSKDKG